MGSHYTPERSVARTSCFTSVAMAPSVRDCLSASTPATSLDWVPARKEDSSDSPGALEIPGGDTVRSPPHKPRHWLVTILPLPRFVHQITSSKPVGFELSLCMLQPRETVAKPLHDHWRKKVVVARRRYSRTPTTEAKTEYSRVLAVFADLVLRNKQPEPGTSL